MLALLDCRLRAVDLIMRWSLDVKLVNKPILAIVAMSLLWGYGWTALKIGLIDAPPFKLTVLRLTLSAICLLLLLPLTGRSLRPRRIKELLTLGFVHTSLLFSLSTWAVFEGSAGRVAFMVYTMPFFTILFARFFLSEAIQRMQWIAISSAGVGLFLIVQPWGLLDNAVSSVLAVGAGVAWAAGAVMVKRLQKREPMDLLSMTAWQMAFGCVPLIIMAYMIPESSIVWSERFIESLIFVAVGVTALGSLLWMYALNSLSAGTASLATLAAPPIAMISSALYFGEQPNFFEWCGMFSIIIALLTLILTSPKKTN